MSTSEPFARSTYFHIFVAASFTGFTLPFSLTPIPALQFSFDIIFEIRGQDVKIGILNIIAMDKVIKEHMN